MVVLQGLQLELELIGFRLENAPLIPLLLDLLSILNQHFVALNFELVTVLAKYDGLLLRLAQASFSLFGIPTKLSGRVAVFRIVFDTHV